MLRRPTWLRRVRLVDPPGVAGAPLRPLLLLALLTVLLRAPGLGRPLLGNFSTKAAVYGMIARNFARGEAHILYPQLDILVGGEPSLHLLECPLSAYLTGALWCCAGGDLDMWGRATSLLWSVLAVVLLYRLVADWHGPVAAVGAAAVLALAPVSVIYGQAFQLEASLIALTILTLMSLQRWLQFGGLHWYALLVLSGAALWLTKIYMVYLLPVLLTLVWEQRARRNTATPRRSRVRPALVGLVLALVPPAVWYANVYHAAQPSQRAESHVYFSLQDTGQAHPIPHPLLKDPEFYKGALDDLTGVVLTPVGFALVLLGAMGGLQRRYMVWLAAAAALVLFAPRKFHEMNYYWLSVLPLLCILAGVGLTKVWQTLMRPDGSEQSSSAPRRLRLAGVVGACAVWLVLSLRYSVVPAFVTPAEDRAVVAAADAVRRHSAPGDRVVTIHGTNIDLLYHCDRKGWTLEVLPESPDDSMADAPLDALNGLMSRGATILVVADLDGLRGAARFRQELDAFPLLQRGDDYAVYRLVSGSGTARISRSAAGAAGASIR